MLALLPLSWEFSPCQFLFPLLSVCVCSEQCLRRTQFWRLPNPTKSGEALRFLSWRGKAQRVARSNLRLRKEKRETLICVSFHSIHRKLDTASDRFASIIRRQARVIQPQQGYRLGEIFIFLYIWKYCRPCTWPKQEGHPLKGTKDCACNDNRG